MEFQAVSRYPEWKQLYDEIIQLIDAGKTTFTYEELDKLCGLDTRTGRGRAQFYRFRRELLKTRQLWMENVSKLGYAIIPPKDHPNAAYRRVNQARRRINTAKAINNNIRIEDLTSEQRLLQAGMAAILHELSKTFHAAGHRFAIASKDPSKLAINLEELTKSIEPKSKRIGPT
jgi:hypothetical protein